MAKQSIGSSTDRWQRPSSRGSSLLPLPSTHNQNQPTAVISPSGLVSGKGGGVIVGGVGHTGSQPQPHHHQQQQHAYQPIASGQVYHPHQHHLPPLPPPPTSHSHPQPPQLHPRKKSVGLVISGSGGQPPSVMNSEHKPDRTRSGAVGSHGPQKQQPSQGTCSGDITTTTAIVHQHDLETLDSCSRNPLLCLICNNVYDDPRLLSCYHSFCAKCLPGRLGDSKIVCPLCGYV